MTPDRFRECLALLDWTQRGLARQLERHEGTVRQWARGTVRIPDDVEAWLEVRATHAAKYPAPARPFAAAAADDPATDDA
ncbi:nuclease [Roseomonas sp. USHLN139]|uniref:nuclease n=1 Tax=Roseomonas sp. USHLN139 TaxID=3081298 RepID=UPI003B02B2AC